MSKSRRWKRWLFSIIFALFFLMSCSGDKWNGRIHKRGGATIIENYGHGMWEGKAGKKITFIKDLTIGKEVGPDYLMFRNNIDISVDPDQNIYVLDIGNCRLVKFDEEGDYVLTIGREGQGPGEFQGPSGVIIDQSLRICILDGNFSIHSYDVYGKHERTYRLDVPMKSFQAMKDRRFFARIEIP
jgi:hypothetical protein